MGDDKNHEIRLNSRPSGTPVMSDFAFVENEIPTPRSGQVLVRNIYMSVDPYMRGRMSDRKSYVAPFQVGEVLQGGAVGRVVSSNGNDDFAAGDYVLSMNGWREWFASDSKGLIKLDPSAGPLRAHLGVLGMPGMTAYVGLMRIASLTKDDRVFVSAAAGAVGSIACQIARNIGCEVVVGSAGTPEKCDYLARELKLFDVVNYRDEPDLSAALAKKMPGGIDFYYDNVGGSHLEAALDNMRDFGRIAVCGMIEQYNAMDSQPAPRNLVNVLLRRLTMRGFIVFDHNDMKERFTSDMREWITDGRMTWRETVVEGIENAPAALLGLFKGDNIGKMLVKLADDDI